VSKPRISPAGDSEGALLSPSDAHLVDQMTERYVEWRARAAAVATAYERWSGAPRREEHQRYSSYTASLDQEQSAATTYEQAVAELRHALERTRRRSAA
jgi:hypothetical protein